MAKMRLDTLLHQRGLFASRARAAASVMAGEVRLGDGRRAGGRSPGSSSPRTSRSRSTSAPRFVSRGGIKLANALAATGVDPSRAGAASTSARRPAASPTACCRRGAAHVVALDVAYGELDWRLRTDERVTVLERTNARAMAAGDLPVRART